jgi:hypothetical protein
MPGRDFRAGRVRHSVSAGLLAELRGGLVGQIRSDKRASQDTKKCPQKDSNLRTWLRRPVLYPLSYGGSLTEKGYQSGDVPVTRAPHLMFTLG